MRTFAKEAWTEQKKSGEIGLAITINRKKCFKCRKPGHVQKDCNSRDNENNRKNNLT